MAKPQGQTAATAARLAVLRPRGGAEARGVVGIADATAAYDPTAAQDMNDMHKVHDMPDVPDVHDVPLAAGWQGHARAAALVRVQAAGLPQRSDEYWKYTPPASLVQPEAPPAALLTPDDPPMFDTVDQIKIVFVDGVFDAAASDALEAHDGLTIERLPATAGQESHWAQDLYGTLEAEGQTPVVRSLAALNTAFATDGILVRVFGQVAKPISLIYRHRDTHSDAMVRHVIRLEKGAGLTLLESGPAAARFNKVIEADIEDGAALHYVRTQGRDHQRRAITHMFARLQRESLFKSFTFTANGALTRNEHVITLKGDKAAAHVAGAAVGDGAFHHDDTVFITHEGENCESRQVFKKVLRNGATGVFQGKILVRPGAQKTDGYQLSQALLLDGDSVFNVKPELEIYADDVACSHGSTAGALDEEALFYLRARGITRAAAADMLALAFLAEAVEEVDTKTLATEIMAGIEGWLKRHRHCDRAP